MGTRTVWKRGILDNYFILQTACPQTQSMNPKPTQTGLPLLSEVMFTREFLDIVGKPFAVYGLTSSQPARPRRDPEARGSRPDCAERVRAPRPCFGCLQKLDFFASNHNAYSHMFASYSCLPSDCYLKQLYLAARSRCIFRLL